MAHHGFRPGERPFTARNIPQDKHIAHTSDATANAFDCRWCGTVVQRTAIVAQALTIMSEYMRVGQVGCTTDGRAH